MLAFSRTAAPTQGTGTKDIDRLLSELEENLESAKLSFKQLESLLVDVKVCGRDASTAGPIFSKRGISIISRYGLDVTDTKALPGSREALRCLANAFLLHEPSRQTFVDIGYAPKAAERLKVDDRDDEFVISRMLFLLTYNTKVDFDELVDQNQLDESINQNIAGHAKAFSTKSGRRKSESSPMVGMSLVETLKLMFNITYYYPDLVQKFSPSIEPLVRLVINHPLPTPPLQSPITYMLNALLNLDLGSSEKKTTFGPETRSSPLFPYSSPEEVVDKLTSIFNKAIMTMPESELDQAAAPLCTLIRRLYELAQPQMKEWMRWIMLPRERDRDKPLGTGDTMAARLLRLSCSPALPTLRENISSLLFELSDKDANKFVKNIGYGFASGFLMSHNIEVPATAAEAGSISSDGDADSGIGYNPVTGQRLSAEEADKANKERQEMSPEEKEREAERLFVLFERLKATGVVDVKNPVQQAVDEGRFEELE
ncbi:uncharacterized protein LTR77_011189 [Saxophila tyrrhenica]|uniref:Uncharacterized protein n=1 Tax=Saxophila tyrrhenica TaxID=1690608 RepID=A0AAV9NTL5_9PEZI|nr:hypothetical protein LTR77_011189 [Saxophila tyrrhenica]